ncbi:MAG: hypothetical protein L6Q35_02175 [Phycisphaerales bacterium]|nr:hypothetical protein [Phycisphaerales bacterium]
MKQIITHLAAAAVLLALSACGTTSVSTTWKTPDPPKEPFTKIVALVLNATPGERRAAEDQLASMISGNRGVPAYSIVPDEDLKDRQKMRADFEKHGVDGAAVLRLVNSETRTRVVSTPDPAPGYVGAGIYDRYGAYTLYRTETVTDTYFYGEFSIYSVADDRLIWSGETQTVNPGGIQDLVRDVGQAVKEELRKQGLLKE